LLTEISTIDAFYCVVGSDVFVVILSAAS